MTSALALPVVAFAGDSHPNGAGTAKAGSPARQAYWDEAGLSRRLKALLATLGPLGVTGARPRDRLPSPALLGHAQSLADSASARRAAATSPRPGPLGIPGVILQAYQRAQQIMATQQPGCHLPWWLLAGIGQVESGQADGGLVDAQGTTLTPILGPVLNGTSGFAAVSASGGGWQRAIGPMQFLPSTWSTWGGGGNPNNIYDAALAAGRYLCVGGWNLSVPAQQVMAVFSYNHSDSYVQEVLTWAYAYAGGVSPLPLRTLPPGWGTTAAPGTPGRPSRRPRPATRSSAGTPARPASSSPPAPSPTQSSRPVSPPSPPKIPTPTPTPLPTLPLPAPTPTLP